ncbi:hypothetical protein GCM10010232_43300 [Streptomyces amakusaensis]|uniref:Uncharacterized protein n=1 Tax=Streptomyces amakusaensis TaxID=67271 RepID=A0ABW0ATV9_9ACTN
MRQLPPFVATGLGLARLLDLLDGTDARRGGPPGVSPPGVSPPRYATFGPQRIPM